MTRGSKPILSQPWPVRSRFNCCFPLGYNLFCFVAMRSMPGTGDNGYVKLPVFSSIDDSLRGCSHSFFCGRTRLFRIILGISFRPFTFFFSIFSGFSPSCIPFLRAFLFLCPPPCKIGLSQHSGKPGVAPGSPAGRGTACHPTTSRRGRAATTGQCRRRCTASSIPRPPSPLWRQGQGQGQRSLATIQWRLATLWRLARLQRQGQSWLALQSQGREHLARHQ
jgi:hypothetical protein